ncbi:MAG: serine/threonine-protein phosphatase [Proteobacteria bacterium]|nr:serine/threonine-protein phosphatase [Pseudomonadota bacterium]MCP4921644.1 serine/threonine-protein phosphatase [Pseudomonadota bacterium]
MRAISEASDICSGDVLYHPALGFARVKDTDDVGLILDWDVPGGKLPRRISEDAAKKGYRVCRRQGFFARSVVDRQLFGEMVRDNPGRGLELLLEDLDDPPERDDVAEWLHKLKIVENSSFTGWWGQAVADQKRLRFKGRRVTLEPTTQPLDDTAPIDQSLPVPWSRLPILRGLDLLETGAELLAKVALHHAAGRHVGLGPDTVTLVEGRLELRVEERGAPATDVHNAGRMLLTRLTGRDLPRQVPPHRVLPFLLGVNPEIPPAAMPLLEKLVSPLFEHRPQSAVGPATDWAAALVLERLRANARPWDGHLHEVGADTHVGWYKMRDTQVNQDAFAIELDDEGQSSLAVVCDGISTSDAGTGDQASRLAVDVLVDVWDRRPKELRKDISRSRQLLDEALREANRAVCEAALDAADGNLDNRIPMGTTAVVAALHGDVVDLANLGDSRAYLMTRSGPALLTADQNVELEWMQGRRSREQDGEMLGQALVGYLGHFDQDDTPALLAPAHRRLRILPGESLVLMTDGIMDYAAHSHIEFLALLDRAVRENRPQQAAQELVRAANDGGGGDNATALVIRLTPSG